MLIVSIPAQNFATIKPTQTSPAGTLHKMKVADQVPLMSDMLSQRREVERRQMAVYRKEAKA
jgi:hypothetical protein